MDLKKFYLLGEKLKHSYSADIHRAFGYDYNIKALKKEELANFIKARDYEGLNVTIPYKETVIPLLDTLDDTAKEVGAVNTIIKENGKLKGYNTDLAGLTYLLDDLGIVLEGKKVLILGSGGTSKTARAVAKAKKARKIVVVSRQGENNYQNLDRHFDSEAIINTTPIGMYPNNGEKLISSLAPFHKLDSVVDAIYNPLYTPLLLEGKQRGVKVANGLKMLVAQAKFSRDLFLGNTSPCDIIEKVYKKLLLKTVNIVLIGMPSSGKSTIAPLLAEKLDKAYIDIDSEIEKKEKLTIPQIFEKGGEEHFRQLERGMLAKYGKEKGAVIAVGGGGVMGKGAYPDLKQNGIIVHITRDIKKANTAGRPLLKDENALLKLYTERMPVYQSFADLTVDNNGELAQTIDKIREKIYEYIGY